MSAVPVPRPAVPVFVPMQEADLDAVAAEEDRIYAFPWSRGNFSDSMASGYSLWLCRDGGVDGELLGYAVMMIVADEAHLLNLSIVPQRQGQGFGATFLAHLADVARSHGATRMLLEVRRSNTAGRALYRRAGFTEIGRRRGYYPALVGREDAVVMARDL